MFRTLSVTVLIASCQGKDPTPVRRSELGSVAGSAATSAAPPKLQAPPLPVPLPGQRKDVTALVGSASRAAIGDLDGDGKGDIVLVDTERLRVVTPEGREL